MKKLRMTNQHPGSDCIMGCNGIASSSVTFESRRHRVLNYENNIENWTVCRHKRGLNRMRKWFGDTASAHGGICSAIEFLNSIYVSQYGGWIKQKLSSSDLSVSLTCHIRPDFFRRSIRNSSACFCKYLISCERKERLILE
jgi:hypothetical protein